MGNPHHRLPPTIHIAGTNGKGSVAAYLRSIAEAAGLKAHVYTSPHLIRFHERIRLAGTLIEEAELLERLEECEAINHNEAITFFEITTAAALQAFADIPADLLILETGLGGRLDATNVVDRKISVITSLSLDHKQYLGDTIESIAYEKAAIARAHQPLIIAPQSPSALAAITAEAAKTKAAPLWLAEHNWSWRGLDSDNTPDAQSSTNYRLWWKSPAEEGELDFPTPALQGPYQKDNAATALLTAQVAAKHFRLPSLALPEAAHQGLRQVNWPGRMMELPPSSPLIGQFNQALPLPPPQSWRIIIDGGHNQAAGEMLAQALAEGNYGIPSQRILLVGMLNTKQADEYLRPLVDKFATIFTLTIPHQEHSFTAHELANLARHVGHRQVIALDYDPFADKVNGVIRALLSLSGQLAPSPDSGVKKGYFGFVTGSLYLAGHVLHSQSIALN